MSELFCHLGLKHNPLSRHLPGWQAYMGAQLGHGELEVSLRYRGVISSRLLPQWFWLRGQVRTGEANLDGFVGDKGKEGEGGQASEDSSQVEKDEPSKEAEKERPRRQEKNTTVLREGILCR